MGSDDPTTIGVVSDIHGNLVALRAVFDAMPAVDALLCAGDVVGYNPWPGACVDAMRERSVPTVMGNHDRAVAADSAFRFHGAARAGLEVAKERLSPAQREWLAGLPDDRVCFDGQVRVVHGHPRDPDRYTYPEEVTEAILGDEPVLVLGHTHVQFVETLDAGIVVNPGSVGQPRDGDARAGFAVLDLDRHEVSTHRVEYDIDRTAAATREAGLPDSLATRLAEGR